MYGNFFAAYKSGKYFAYALSNTKAMKDVGEDQDR